ncbi:MAG: proline dehydrogenase family protein [Planctomycetota bacterium]
MASIDRTSIEKRILEIGGAYLERSKDSGNMFEAKGPLGKAMAWVMDDPQFKVDMFRLVDVMPMLQTPAEVAEHLNAYLGTRNLTERGWMSKSLGWLAGNSLTAGLTARAVQANVGQMAHIFIAGASAAEALKILARRRKDGIAFTLDLLGEAAVASDEADVYQQRYLELLDTLAGAKNLQEPHAVLTHDDRGPIPAINISVKLSALFPFCDPLNFAGSLEGIAGRLAPILRRGRDLGFFVNWDMENWALKDLTLTLFERMMLEPEFKTYPHFGIALQAYLKSGPADLSRVVALARKRGAPLTVRLVKGAYWDYENIVSRQQHWPLPVFADKSSTDATYEVMTEAILENRQWIKPAFGTHNVRSLAHAIAYAQAINVPPAGYEFQMLYGMADSVKKALARDGYRVREYVPIGEVLPGMAYLVRRLLENTSNESFLRHQYQEKASLQVLLKPPLLSPQAPGPGGSLGAPAPVAPAAPNTPNTPAAAAGADADLERRLDRPFENEPVLDFSNAAERARYHEALTAARGRLGQRHFCRIDGKPVDTAQTLLSVNPANPAETIGASAAADAALARQAVDVAVKAAPAWAATPWTARAVLLLKAADLMRRRHHELAAWITLETAKPWRESSADVAEAIDFCEYYARAAHALRRPRRVSFMPGEDSIYAYRPKGPTVVISPWNFPLAIPTGMVAAALVTGNPVIFKPAEQSTLIGARLVELLLEAGFPPGVIAYLPGPGEIVGPALIEHPAVHTIAFTGSMAVGLKITQLASQVPAGQAHVKRVIAEMGGKNAIIVDDDADLDEAVLGVAQSAFGYAGQKCSACSRVIVLGATGERFVKRLVGRIRDLTLGPAENPGCDVPPVIDADAHARLTQAIAAARQKYTVLGDRPVPQPGYFVPPVVVTGVRPEDPLAQDELFGPVLTVLEARDFDHALAIANGTRFALTGGVYSRHPEHLAQVRERFHVGNLYINRPITGALVGRQPFGGFGLSGVGSKAGGPDYLLQFVNPYVVTENTMRRGFAPETVILDAGSSEKK